MPEVILQAWQAIETLGVEKVFLLLMGPVFVVFMAVEAWHLQRRRVQTYSVEQVGTNTLLAVSHSVADGIAWLLVIGVFYALYEVRLFEIPVAWWSLILLLVLQDFSTTGFTAPATASAGCGPAMSPTTRPKP